jgi:protein-disulfide isomerase
VSNRFFIILLVVIAVIFGVFFVTKNDKSDNGQTSGSAQASNHTDGAGTSGVTLIEYGDFQCPACKAYYPVVKEIKQKYGDKITFQFRNFPLNSHVNARQAHRAAEAAAAQGKFWEMHDLLYENQDAWASEADPTNVFVGLANALKLDIEKFNTDLRSSAVNDIINADIAEGNKVPATATPTFVLNGTKLDPNPTSIEEFMAKIDEAIASKSQQ